MSPFSRLVFTAAVLLLAPGIARAQQTAAVDVAVGSAGAVDFGVRLNSISGDEARNQRYRDLRNGPTVDRLRYNHDEGKWMFSGGVDHAGYRDQRYFGEYRLAGKIKLNFIWDQVPQFNSAVASTPFTSPSPGVFLIADSLQQGMEAGTIKLSDVAATATPFDLRSKRTVAALNLVYTAARNLDLKLDLRSTQRKGAQQWGIGFGFSNQFEVPAPLDHRTLDVGTALEWANARGMFRVGYDGSYFHNNVESLTVDNPLRFTDTTAATGHGRMALWPSSHSNSVNAAGSIKFPAHSQWDPLESTCRHASLSIL